MHEVRVERCQNKYSKWLNLYIYEEESQRLAAIEPLAEVYGDEEYYRGGRFQRYRDRLKTNRIVLELGTGRRASRRFVKILDWLGEHMETEWSMDFQTEASAISLQLFFEDVEDAVLCRLSF